jgi:branched-chain amino acid transport system permease protein
MFSLVFGKMERSLNFADMEFTNFVQITSNGMALGCIYVLVALGLYITHLTSHQVNFGQGDFLMVGAFTVLFMRKIGAPLVIAFLCMVTILAVLGFLLERMAIRPLERKRAAALGSFSWILTTAGVALILQNIIELSFGKTSQYSEPLFSKQRDQVINFFGAGLYVEEIIVIVVAILVVGIFYAFMFRSKWGKSIQAVAFNSEAAQLLGINTQLLKTLVFVIASILAGIAGVLIGPLVTINPHMGLVFTIKALIVAAIGGFSNPFGILVGGVIFGIFESASNYFDSSLGDLYPLIAALIVIAYRPSGLFGSKNVDVR